MPSSRRDNLFTLLSMLALVTVPLFFQPVWFGVPDPDPEPGRHFHFIGRELQPGQWVTGKFSLAPNAFIALGAYTAALLTMTPEEKKIS